MQTTGLAAIATGAISRAAAVSSIGADCSPGTSAFTRSALAIAAFVEALPESAMRSELQRLMAAVPAADVGEQVMPDSEMDEDDATLMLLNEAISLGRRDGMAGQHLSAMCDARDRLEHYGRQQALLAFLTRVPMDAEGVTHFIATVRTVTHPWPDPGEPPMRRATRFQPVPASLSDLAGLLVAFSRSEDTTGGMPDAG